MDEMKIKLSTKFMRGIVAKVMSKIIYKNTGVKSDICINELEVELIDGKIRFHIDADGELDDAVLLKLNRVIDSGDLDA